RRFVARGGRAQLIGRSVLRRRVGRSHIPAKFLVRSGVYAPPASVSSLPAVYTNFHLRILRLRCASRRGLAKASADAVRVLCWRRRRGLTLSTATTASLQLQAFPRLVGTNETRKRTPRRTCR